MKRRDIEGRVRRIALPAPASSLRKRVLAAAVVAPPPINWSDRVWFSRGWRLAAVGAMVAIGVLEQLADTAVPRMSNVPARVVAEAQAIEETGREMGLPAELVASLGRRVLSDASRVQPTDAATSLLKTLEADDTGGTR
jgi:hypothetical protein